MNHQTLKLRFSRNTSVRLWFCSTGLKRGARVLIRLSYRELLYSDGTQIYCSSGDGTKKKKELRLSSCLSYEVFSYMADMLWWPFQLNNKGCKFKVMKWKKVLRAPRCRHRNALFWIPNAASSGWIGWSPVTSVICETLMFQWGWGNQKCCQISVLWDENPTIYDISATTLAKW